MHVCVCVRVCACACVRVRACVRACVLDVFLCSFSWEVLTPQFSDSYCLDLSHARFTLADPMPRLASDVVGGKSGRNHPTSCRHPIHIGRMARNAYIRVGWYEGVVQYWITPWFVR